MIFSNKIFFRRKRPEVLVAVLQELIRRKVIERTLIGRKESEVCSLLRFMMRHFADLNWQPVLIKVLGTGEKIFYLDFFRLAIYLDDSIGVIFSTPPPR